MCWNIKCIELHLYVNKYAKINWLRSSYWSPSYNTLFALGYVLPFDQVTHTTWFAQYLLSCYFSTCKIIVLAPWCLFKPKIMRWKMKALVEQILELLFKKSFLHLVWTLLHIYLFILLSLSLSLSTDCTVSCLPYSTFQEILLFLLLKAHSALALLTCCVSLCVFCEIETQ